jgi:hypothetical protein
MKKLMFVLNSKTDKTKKEKQLEYLSKELNSKAGYPKSIEEVEKLGFKIGKR